MYRRILVAYDGSPESELIRRAAERMGEEPVDPPSVHPDEVPPQLGTRFAARGDGPTVASTWPEPFWMSKRFDLSCS